MMWRWAVAVMLMSAGMGAEAETAARLAREVNAGVAALAAKPTVAAWRRRHGGERFARARIGAGDELYEADDSMDRRWCGVDVSHLAGGVVRAAEFYVPEVREGVLPALPERVDEALVETCAMEAVWYQAAAPVDGLVRELSVMWGAPNGTRAKPNVPGWAQWRDVTAWRRAGVSVWVAYDPFGPGGITAQPRLVVYARRDGVREGELWAPLLPAGVGERALAEAVKLAAPGDSAMASGILRGTWCKPGKRLEEEESAAVARARRWLRWADGFAAPRRAAALVVANAYVACNAMHGEKWRALGVRFETRCPQDGPTYSRNLLDKAAADDPGGKVSELVGILFLAEPCSVRGEGLWQDRVIAFGEKLLRTYKEDDWTPWVHLGLGRAHDMRLRISYPDGDPEENGLKLSEEEKQRERDAAIGYFRRFVEDKPGSSEAVDAWQEGWRLLAELPPSPVGFGCGCE